MVHCFGSKARSVGANEDTDRERKLKTPDSAPICTSDDQGTDFWIKKYNAQNARKGKKPATLSRVETDMIIDENAASPTSPPLSADVPQTQTAAEANDALGEPELYYLPMMAGLARAQSTSDIGRSKVKHQAVESALSVTSDDLGTDYWIKQYNKENRSKQKKNKKRKLNKTKSARHKLKSKRLSKRLRSHAQAQSTHDPSTSMALLDSNSGDSNKLFRDDFSDVASVKSMDCVGATLSAYSSMTTGSTVVSSIASSRSSSGASSPDTTCSEPVSFLSPFTHAHAKPTPSQISAAVHTAARQVKYGVYPFKLRRQHISKRFTGIVRTGHRYQLRDGRVGVARYVNQTRFAPGTWIGVELDKPEGEHDGTVVGVRYFSCAHGYGTFVKKSNIARCIGKDTTGSLSMAQLMNL